MFRLVEYDDDINGENLKNTVERFVNEHVKELTKSKEETINQILYAVSRYAMKVFMVFDGGYTFGIIACSTQTFYYHQILRYVFLESKYQTTEIYNSLFDLLIQTTEYQGLAIISLQPISVQYLEAEFFPVRFRNSESAYVYFRTLSKEKIINKEEYMRKQIKYLRGFVTMYCLYICSTAVLILSIIFGGLYIYSNLSGNPQIYIPSFISLGFLVLTLLSKYFLTRFNKNGKNTFGFQYDIVQINQFQYKFRNKVKEIFLGGIQAFLDSGV